MRIPSSLLRRSPLIYLESLVMFSICIGMLFTDTGHPCSPALHGSDSNRLPLSRLAHHLRPSNPPIDAISAPNFTRIAAEFSTTKVLTSPPPPPPRSAPSNLLVRREPGLGRRVQHLVERPAHDQHADLNRRPAQTKCLSTITRTTSCEHGTRVVCASKRRRY